MVLNQINYYGIFTILSGSNIGLGTFSTITLPTLANGTWDTTQFMFIIKGDIND